MVNVLEKAGGIILLIVCENFSLTMSFNLFCIIIYFKNMVRLRISLVCTALQIQFSYDRTI